MTTSSRILSLVGLAILGAHGSAVQVPAMRAETVSFVDGRMRAFVVLRNVGDREARFSIAGLGFGKEFDFAHQTYAETTAAALPGSMRIRIKPRGMLAKAFDAHWNGVQALRTNAAGFVPGDLDDDNLIELWEISQVQRFASDPTPSPMWAIESPYGWFDREQCDWNLDGKVDAKDVALVAANLWRRGQD